MPTPVLAPKIDKEPKVAEAINENVTLLDDLGSSEFRIDKSILSELHSITENRRRRVIKARVHPSKSTTALVELGDIHALKGEIRVAIKTYINAIKLDKYNVDAYKKLLPLLIREKSFGTAEYFYSELLDITNNHPSIRNDYILFQLIAEEGSLDKTYQLLQKFVKDNSTYTPYMITEGVIQLIYSKNLDKASKKFKDVLKLEPENIHANNNLGICLQHQSKFNQAQKYLEKAIAIDSSYLPGYENSASNFLAQNKIPQALKALESAKDAGLKLSDLWEHNYGFFLLITRQLDRAVGWYKNKIKEEPSNNLLFNNLGVCLENKGKFKSAKKYYLQAVDLYLSITRTNPGYSDARAFNAFQNACRLLQKYDEYKLQEQIAKKFVELAPDNPAAHYYLGASRIQLKKFESAEKHLRTSIEIDDNVLAPYLDLSFLYDVALHDYEASIKLLNAALSKNLSNELLYNNLAFAYIKSGNLDKARSILKKEFKSSPFNATKGLLAFHEGKFKAGNKFYKEAVDSLPPDKQAEAIQVWDYEQSNYWLRNNDLNKALEFIIKAKKSSSETIIYPDIIELEKQIKQALKHSAVAK